MRQISGAIVRLNQGKKQHPILICDEAHLLPHPALEQLPLLLNFDMDSARYLTLLLVGQPLLRRTYRAFLDCLRQAIAARGIPTRLYMDNAKIYRSPQSIGSGRGLMVFPP